jgi:membrane protease YdiL (CAAX protease family)
MTRRLGVALTPGLLPVGLLLVGFGAAVLTRVVSAGTHPAASQSAGLLFAACLLLLCVASGAARPTVDRHTAAWVGLGALLLCVPALVSFSPDVPGPGFVGWAAAVTVVVLAEEAFLRGALFTVVQRAAGPAGAVLVTAAAFAALHVPLYGWRVVPLDFAVGLLLGALRLGSGSWVAPAGAHAIADYVGWFCA